VAFSIGFEALKFIYQITFLGNPVFRMKTQIKYKNKNKILISGKSTLCSMFIKNKFLFMLTEE